MAQTSAERSPLVAGLLAAIGSPGLGQLYNGRLAKTLVVLVGSPVLVALLTFALLRARAGPVHFLWVLVLALAIWLLTVLDAVRDARRHRDVPRPWFGGWIPCVVAWVITSFVLVPFGTVAILRSTVQAFVVAGSSMAPGLLEGDYILADRTAYGFRMPFGDGRLAPRAPRRLDLACFLFPNDRTRTFIHRVIGLPGETVSVRSGRAVVDGRALDEPYVMLLDDPEGGPADEWGPETVPAGQYLVLGDNRQNSRDSRFFGYVPADDFVGRVAFVYLSLETSRDDGQRRIRRDRIGHVPR